MKAKKKAPRTGFVAPRSGEPEQQWMQRMFNQVFRRMAHQNFELAVYLSDPNLSAKQVRRVTSPCLKDPASGNRCAIGALLPNRLYPNDGHKPKMLSETNGGIQFVLYFYTNPYRASLTHRMNRFLTRLQLAHDAVDYSKSSKKDQRKTFRKNLLAVAKEFDMKVPKT